MRRPDPPFDLRLIVLALLALGLRLLYIAALSADSPIASIDAWGYHRLALNLAQGNGFSLQRASPFISDNIRTPLYPLFLLLIRQTFGPSPRMAAVAQAMLETLTTLLTYRLAARLAGRPAGRLAALLYALYPTQVHYTHELLTEIPLALLLTWSILVFLEYTRSSRRLWLIGLAGLSGLTVLCKPNLQYLPLLWAALIGWGGRQHARRLLRDVVLFAGIVICILLPWMARNRLTFGRWLLSTAFEGNLSRVSVPAALAQADGLYVPPWSEVWEGYFLRLVEQTAQAHGWSKPWHTLTAGELDAQNHQIYLAARRVIGQHVAAWMVSHAQGLLRYLEPQTFKVCYARFAGRHWPADVLDDVPIHAVRWIGGGHWGEAVRLVWEERWLKLDGAQRMVWWGMLVGQIIGGIVVGRGVWRLRRQSAVAAILLLTIGYVLILPGPIAYERFGVPVSGLLCGLAALGVCKYSHH